MFGSSEAGRGNTLPRRSKTSDPANAVLLLLPKTTAATIANVIVATRKILMLPLGTIPSLKQTGKSVQNRGPDKSPSSFAKRFDITVIDLTLYSQPLTNTTRCTRNCHTAW